MTLTCRTHGVTWQVVGGVKRIDVPPGLGTPPCMLCLEPHPKPGVQGLCVIVEGEARSE